MKKGRPGLVLTVQCNEEKLNEVVEKIFALTPTIGLRYYKTKKLELEREIVKVETEFGTCRVKVTKDRKGELKIKPESEDVLKYSSKNKISPHEVSLKIIEAYNKKI